MPVYDMSNPADRLKFLVSLLSKEQRQDWIKYFKKKYGIEAAEELKAELVKIHEKQKETA